MSAVHICTSTALGEVPTKLLMWKFCPAVAEEDFYVPPRLVKVGDGTRRKRHVVGEQHHREMVQGVVHGYPAYGLGILFRRFVPREPDNLVYEDFGMCLVWQVTLFYALVEQVLFYPDDEEHFDAVPKLQKGSVEASPCHTYDDTSGLFTSLRSWLPCCRRPSRP